MFIGTSTETGGGSIAGMNSINDSYFASSGVKMKERNRKRILVLCTTKLTCVRSFLVDFEVKKGLNNRVFQMSSSTLPMCRPTECTHMRPHNYIGINRRPTEFASIVLGQWG
ncbi:hypothetical protein BRADI_2g55295v3 [Brachypodium distachyon]|uniref:Uncharacterized protein n=1 Tax=Brachypodium distachyon TaxID=15368 RepID=A0A2K2DG25_BRADI|nr:hypothetical protein BRADI_2g55295v3 [Brachypodium distachyon]